MKSGHFIIIGERRCGTTTLFNILQNHPNVYLYSKADINFFIEEEITESRIFTIGKADATQWEKTHSLEQYEKLFAGINNEPAFGHKGPDLFFWKASYNRIKSYSPDCKFILILRNPIKRAWSHYWNEVGKGRENLSFEEAISKENERIEISDYALDHLSYISRGYYDKTLGNFLETFDKSKLKIIILEEYFQDPQKSFDSICEFLEVPYSKLIDQKQAKNQNWTMIKKIWVRNNFILNKLDNYYTGMIEKMILFSTKNTDKRRKLRMRYYSLFKKAASEERMSNQLHKRLLDIYMPHIENLEKMLNKNLGIWKR